MTHPAHGHDHSVDQVVTELADAAKQAVEDVNKRAGRDMVAATVVGLALLGVAGGSLLWFPWGFAVFAAALGFGAQVEMAHAITRQRGTKVVLVPLLAGTATFILGAYAVHAHDFVEPSAFLLATAGLTVVLVAVVRLAGPIPGYVTDVTTTLFLFAYPGLLISGLMFILAEPGGPAKVATMVLGVAGADTGGLLLGMLIGKHPFAPRISPKKTWEGIAGSFLLAGVGVIPMTVFVIGAPWWKGAILAVVIAVVATAGDLVESVIKRDLGIKDMGRVLQGHGGIMDRLDSYVLTAVPAYLTMLWLFGNA